MALKYEYDDEDDIFTIYDNENRPSETIEFSEFLNIDINKNKMFLKIITSVFKFCRNNRQPKHIYKIIL